MSSITPRATKLDVSQHNCVYHHWGKFSEKKSQNRENFRCENFDIYK